MGGLTIENNFFILKIEKRNKIIVFDFQKVGAGAQKSGGAAALPAPPPPRSLMRRTEALASVKFYQILSIFIFFITLTILEDFIRLISYSGPCVRLGCSFFLATALVFLPLHIMWQCTSTSQTSKTK